MRFWRGMCFKRKKLKKAITKAKECREALNDRATEPQINEYQKKQLEEMIEMYDIAIDAMREILHEL